MGLFRFPSGLELIDPGVTEDRHLVDLLVPTLAQARLFHPVGEGFLVRLEDEVVPLT